MRGLRYLLPGLLAVFIACSSGNEPAQTATSVPLAVTAEPTVSTEPTATSIPQPTATASPESVPATNGAMDSPTEAELLEKAERTLTAHINKDWDTFLDSCARASRPSRNVENLEGELARLLGDVEPEDVSLTGFIVTPLIPPEVLVIFNVIFAGQNVGRDALTWTVENGQWVNKDCRVGHQ